LNASLGKEKFKMKQIHHVCIQTEKYNESLEFYTKIMGFSVHKETKNFHDREYNTWLRLHDFYIELQTPKKGENFKEYSTKNSGIVHMCFAVENVQNEYDRIKNLGYENFKNKNGKEIYLVEDGYLFKVKAPEGTEIEVRDQKDI
jgi:glyoxylase I family protein